jgi:hypothetical protein
MSIKKRTISVCSHPECDGWAAAHFADAMGMWHDHDGERFDFEPVEVVEAGEVKAAMIHPDTLKEVETEWMDPLGFGLPTHERRKRCIETACDVVLER